MCTILKRLILKNGGSTCYIWLTLMIRIHAYVEDVSSRYMHPLNNLLLRTFSLFNNHILFFLEWIQCLWVIQTIKCYRHRSYLIHDDLQTSLFMQRSILDQIICSISYFRQSYHVVHENPSSDSPTQTSANKLNKEDNYWEEKEW